MHGEQTFTLASSSAHYLDCSNYYLLHNTNPWIHLLDIMVDVAMEIPMSNMDGDGGIQSLLPADMGTMKINIIP